MADPTPEEFQKLKETAHKLYTAQRHIYNPYFRTPVVLNSDGFHHLQFSARRERSKSEQAIKMRLLKRSFDVLRKAGTVQEYRKIYEAVGKQKRDGFTPMKEVEYWAFVAIVGTEYKLKIRVITRKVGNGNISFWSVMPDSKITNGQQRLAAQGIEDD